MHKTIDYAIIQEPLAKILIAANDKGVVLVEFLAGETTDIVQYLQNNFHQSLIRKEGPYVEEGKKQLEEYFQGLRKEFTCAINPQGTEFQKKVWDQLQQIPFGQTKSYGEISSKVLGNNKGARAVGQANGKNPIAIIIPCHRVINQEGSLGGFSGGLHIKKWLLEWEKKILYSY
ncbi:MAG: methylated-DNA--[protein]-cysteine S-methyltransferase [Clostridia bacterium]|jgi:methylated-DNA-[protein]-cysteine S-methyltransferase|nr:methylated-DNA--[protein]-cysteine S-methyltransferase [Clostridia bacterium]